MIYDIVVLRLSLRWIGHTSSTSVIIRKLPPCDRITRIDLTPHVEGHDSFACGDVSSFYYARSLPSSCKRVNRVSLSHAQSSSSEQQHPYHVDAEVNSYFHQGITTCHGIDPSHEVMHMHHQPDSANYLALDDRRFTTDSLSMRSVDDARCSAQVPQSSGTPALLAWLSCHLQRPSMSPVSYVALSSHSAACPDLPLPRTHPTQHHSMPSITFVGPESFHFITSS